MVRNPDTSREMQLGPIPKLNPNPRTHPKICQITPLKLLSFNQASPETKATGNHSVAFVFVSPLSGTNLAATSLE
jgi:hypothetical protein